MLAVSPIVWVWLVASIIGLVVYLRLRHRAVLWDRDPDIAALAHDHPVRRLARSHLRNHTLWVIASFMSATVGVSIIVRDVADLPFEVPAGFSVVGMLWLLATMVAVGMLDEHDNQEVDADIAEAATLASVAEVGRDTNERVRNIEESGTAPSVAAESPQSKRAATDGASSRGE